MRPQYTYRDSDVILRSIKMNQKAMEDPFIPVVKHDEKSWFAQPAFQGKIFEVVPMAKLKRLNPRDRTNPLSEVEKNLFLVPQTERNLGVFMSLYEILPTNLKRKLRDNEPIFISRFFSSHIGGEKNKDSVSILSKSPY